MDQEYQEIFRENYQRIIRPILDENLYDSSVRQSVMQNIFDRGFYIYKSRNGQIGEYEFSELAYQEIRRWNAGGGSGQEDDVLPEYTEEKRRSPVLKIILFVFGVLALAGLIFLGFRIFAGDDSDSGETGKEVITELSKDRKNEINDYAGEVIRNYALNHQNQNFARLMNSGAEVKEEGYNASIESIETVADYMVIPEDPSKAGFDNKFFVICKVTGSDYANEKLVSYVTFRITDITEEGVLNGFDHYLAPYGERRAEDAYDENIKPYEEDARIKEERYIDNSKDPKELKKVDSAAMRERKDDFSDFAKSEIMAYALNNQNNNFRELMNSDAEVIDEGFNAQIFDIEVVKSYLVKPVDPEEKGFYNKYFIIARVMGSDYMHSQLVSYVTIRLTDVDPDSDISDFEYYLVPYGEESIEDAYNEHIEQYENDCRVTPV